MTGFEKYTEEMAEFRKSKLYREKYAALITILWGHDEAYPITSPSIENMLQLVGTEVRALVSHACCDGKPIVSCGSGYYMEGNYDKMLEANKHLKERAMKMLFRFSRQEQLCPRNNQTRLDI